MAEAININIPEIEKELKRLSAKSKDQKEIKACLFTLIIYANEPRRVAYFQDLVGTILDKFPCRIIFIQRGCSKEASGAKVDVANVTSGRNGSLVVCDQITIKVSDSQLARVPYIVIPHIVPDLPVYLLWSQTPFEENIIFPALKPYASRIIFDSECSESLHRFCKEMLQNLKTLNMDLMDVNWALVSNWRDVIAQLFDSPKKISVLEQCKTLRITYNGAKTKTLFHPDIRAIYLQGWIASRLNWNFKTVETFEDNLIFSYASSSCPKIVCLCPHPQENLPPGAIISIDIHAADGTSYFISRKQSLSQVMVHLSTSEKCELPFSLPLPDVHRGLTFMKEIFFHKLSDHYQGMLQVLTNMR